MKRQKQQLSLQESFYFQSTNETTINHLLPLYQYQLLSKDKQPINNFSENSVQQHLSKGQLSSSSNHGIQGTEQQQKAISEWLSKNPRSLHEKSFKPKLSTFLLPKLHITNFTNLKFQFELPSSKPKYIYDISDRELYEEAEFGKQWKGIHVNVHINSFLIMIDIIITLTLFTLSAFEALLQQFTNYQTKKLSVRLITNFCLLFLLLRNALQSIKITTYHRRLIYRIKDIIVHRLTQPVFIIDLIIIVLLFLSIEFEDQQVLGIVLYVVTFIKAYLLRWHFYILQKIYTDSLKQKLWWNLLKMFILNIFFAHTFSTILLSFYYIDKSYNWIIKFGYATRPWYEIYIWAFYWASGIIPNAGFGDIYPASLSQAIIVALVKVLTLSIVVLIDIIRMDAILRLRQAGQRKTGIFMCQAEKDKISSDLKERIARYLNRAQKDDTVSTYQERIVFLRSLPTSLQQKYLIQLSQKRLRKLPVFQLFNNSTIINISLKIYQTYYSPTDILLDHSIKRPNRISILKHGKANFLCKHNSSHLSRKIVHSFQVNQSNPHLKDPILLDCLFMENSAQLNYDVVAVKTSKVLHLGTNEFFDTVRQSEMDREYFFQLYHRQSFMPNQWCKFKCINCSDKFHTLFDCPKLHYVPVREIIYLKQVKPGSFESRNKRNTIFNRRTSKLRQKERFNNFLLINQFKKMETIIGINSIKTSFKSNFKLTVPFSNTQIHKQDQFITKHLIQKNKSPFTRHLDSEKSFILEKQSSPPKFQSFDRQSLSTGFYDPNYLYGKNRAPQLKVSAKQGVNLLKNRLYDLITQRLEPQFHGFWDIEMDKMQNYKNYFPLHNPNRFNLQSVHGNTLPTQKPIKTSFRPK